MRCIRTVFWLLVIISVSSCFAQQVMLVDKGGANFEIISYKIDDAEWESFPFNGVPHPYYAFENYDNICFERLAAVDLQKYIENMSGVKLDIRFITNKDELNITKPYIAIGRLAVDLGAIVPKSEFGISGNVIDISADRILLAGEQPISAYYAVARFLENIGCRWYMPGELGEFVPKLTSIALEAGSSIEVPDLIHMRLWYSDLSNAEEQGRFAFWNLRNRQYGINIPSAHVWESILPKQKYFQAHPEWFALINGERKPVMLCTTNQEMIAEFVKNYKAKIRENPKQIFWSLSPDDGVSFCECSNCTALDSGEKDKMIPSLPIITDRLVVFFNQVVEEILKEYPDKYFVFYAYVNYTAPPVREKLHPRLYPMVAPILFSRFHAMNAKNSETIRTLANYIEKWAEASERVFYYGYAYNLANVVMPYSKEHQVRYDWPFMRKNKLAGVSIESMKVWPNMLPWYYLLAKLNIDVEADQEAVLADFYKNFFGPVAPEMRAYLEMLSTAYASLDYEVGNMWSAHLVFTDDFFQKADQLINSALEKTEEGSIHYRRVKMFADTLQTAKIFLEFRQQVNDFEFAKAAETSGRLKEHGLKMYHANPESTTLFFPYQNYLPMFWLNPIDFCAEKLTNSEIIYKFPDEWYAFLDFSQLGETGEIFDPDFPLSKWIKLKTYSKTITEQGLAHYRGIIWYRHDFTIGDEYEGKEIKILFAGIDDTIEVYLNGEHIGGPSSGTFSAFEFNLTPAIKFNETNVLVVKTSNYNITELGTGGIMRPVLLHTARGKKQKFVIE